MAQLPTSVVRAALGAMPEVTERITAEFARAGTPEPHWPAWKWGVARAVVTMHGMAGVLARNSNWHAAPGWREFLHQQRAHIAERQQSVARLVDAVASSASEARIRVVVLKGAALPQFGLAPSGSRPLADLDLLVNSADGAATTALLQGLGYREDEESWKHIAFSPLRSSARQEFGEHSDRAIGVDLHFSIQERLAGRTFDITREIFAPSGANGVGFYPSRVALMRHLLLHAAGNMATQWLRAIQLHDIASLAAQFEQSDWDGLLAAGLEAGERWWTFAPLLLTDRYWTDTIPPRVLDALSRECGVLHRRAVRDLRLAEVSASNPRLAAFPELPWCRSPLAVLQYCWRRVFPARETIVSYGHLQQTTDFARDADWFQKSQASRMLKWLFARPPRPASLFMISGGLQSQAADGSVLSDGLP